MKDFLISSYFPVICVAIMVIILMVIVVALYRTYQYFIDRFPRDADAYDKFTEYTTKAQIAKKEYDALLEAQQRIKEELKESIKEAREYGIDKAVLEQTNEDLAKANDALQKAKEDSERINSQNFTDRLALESTLERKRTVEQELSSLEERLQEIKSLGDYKKLTQLRNELESVTKELTENKIGLQIYSEKIENLKSQIKSMQQEFDEKYVEAQNNFQDKFNEIKNKYSFEKKKVEEDYNQKKIALDRDYNQQKLTIEAELRKLNDDVKKQQVLSKEIAQKKVDLEILQNKCGEYKAKLAIHQQELENSDIGYESLQIIPESLAVLKDKPTLNKGVASEIGLLEEFKEYLESKEYYFSSSVIKAFHTSLKIQNISPLTVLAGISGTGKTLLPSMYANFFGIYQLMMPVQPRWDSPQDLLGFYNYLEKKYQATELAQSLVCFDGTKIKDKKDVSFLKDRMMMVLLDEMNLARTEYYFSEFLSRLEMRRTVDEDNLEQRKKAEILIDNKFGSVWVPSNVLFVGTMNEDESTQTLSDKVLDRTNLLRFGKPRQFNFDNRTSGNKTTCEDQYGILTKSIWDKWVNLKVDNKIVTKEFEDKIDKLNEAMSIIGKPFGYRVSDAIRLYLSNYPSERRTDTNSAFADQIEQKIMPKLRGCDLQNENTRKCIEIIREIIDSLQDDELTDAFDKASDAQRHEMFIWQGISR